MTIPAIHHLDTLLNHILEYLQTVLLVAETNGIRFACQITKQNQSYKCIEKLQFIFQVLVYGGILLLAEASDHVFEILSCSTINSISVQLELVESKSEMSIRNILDKVQCYKRPIILSFTLYIKFLFHDNFHSLYMMSVPQSFI